MTKAEFDASIEMLCVAFSGSITGGRRTQGRNELVEGATFSRHLFGFGADVVLDDPANEPFFIRAAKTQGIRVIVESDHLHCDDRG